MRSVIHTTRTSISLVVLVILVLWTSSCAYLPEELQIEIERAYREQTEPLIEALKRQAIAQLEQYKEELTRRIEETWEDSTQKAKAFLGLEADPDVGRVALGIDPETAKETIEAAFKDVYREAGGGRVIGWPEGVVTYWDRSTSELLVQYFTGGTQKRSVIVLMDGEEAAFVLPGEWLEVYEGLGGPVLAGCPASNPETWNINPQVEVWVRWGRGRRQLFSLSGETYALMQPSGLDTVFVVPPMVWSRYLGATATQIGYPLSSYPLDDSRWREQTTIPDESRAILNRWEAQPIRMQVFENGSLVWLASEQQVEVIERGTVAGFMNLGRASLLLGVRRELGFIYDDLQFSDQSDMCFLNTVRHGANMAADASGDILIPQVALLPLRATLQGVELSVGSVLGKLALAAADALVDLAGGDQLGDAAASAIAGQVVDAIYTKAVGDILSVPLTGTTVDILEEEVARLNRGRIAEESSVQIGDGNVRFRADMNAQLNVEYDPLTRTLSGVIVSDCAPQGIAFFYRMEPSTGYKAAATDVWDGRVHFIDLATGNALP